MKRFWVLVIALVLNTSVSAEESSESEVILRMKGGYSFLANAGRDGAPGLGMDFEAQITPHFALGAFFSVTVLDEVRSGNTLISGIGNISSFGVNPKFTLRTGAAKIGFGALIGAQGLNAGGPNTRGLALGINASLDVPIYATLNMCFAPAYLQSVSGGSNVSEIQLALGLSLIL